MLNRRLAEMQGRLEWLQDGSSNPRNHDLLVATNDPYGKPLPLSSKLMLAADVGHGA